MRVYRMLFKLFTIHRLSIQSVLLFTEVNLPTLEATLETIEDEIEEGIAIIFLQEIVINTPTPTTIILTDPTVIHLNSIIPLNNTPTRLLPIILHTPLDVQYVKFFKR